MRAFFPPVLLALLCFCCISALGQQAAPLRIGVAVLSNGGKTVSGTEVRDRLIKLLHRPKHEKDSHLDLEAVPLSASLREAAMNEAREKNCAFVLYTRLTDLETNSVLSPLDGIYVPTFHVTVEFQLNRASDGAGFAIASVDGDDTTTIHDAIWKALSHIATNTLAEIKKGQAMPKVPAVAEDATIPPPALLMPIVDAHNYCAWLPSNIDHAPALHGVCEYAISLPQKMPNFVCAQETARYQGYGTAPLDLISASVRYEDGHESYSDIKINGRAASSGFDQSAGLRSTGEFAGNLRAIFDRSNRAQFVFSGEDQVAGGAAFKFSFRIAEQKDPLWVLRAPNQTLAPPYSGELWIDQKDGAVVRFTSAVKDTPPSFPMRSVDSQIDYERIAFGDGTDFVLPVDYTLTNVYSGAEASRNVVRFRDCHKFRATAHILLSRDQGSPASDAADTLPSLDSLQKDLEENEAIFAAVSQQALRQSELSREAEQKKMLDSVTAATLQTLPVPKSQPAATPAQPVAVATSAPAPSDPTLPRLKVNVNLVLVSVVLRDSKGHAVGDLKQENFQLFDEGKPQVITQFSLESAASRVPSETSAAPVATQSADHPAANQSRPAGERDTAYLVNDVHASLPELAAVRKAAERYLSSLQPGDRAAIFTTSGTVAVDFTDNRAQLLAGLQKLLPHPTVVETECPPISYYMADLISKGDTEARGLAVSSTLECGGALPGPHAGHVVTARAAEVLKEGNIESRNALGVLAAVVRRTQAMPGQRTIVLVSPGFLALTTDMHEDVMAIVDGALRSGIVINTLDAGGLTSAGSIGGSGYAQFDLAEAQARGDLMAEFASGTGGVFFHNNNNLEEGFRRTADAPEFVYVLGFAPQKLDGRLHKLKVSLRGASKVEINARRAYYAPKPATRKAE